jgi:hypothetical protein
MIIYRLENSKGHGPFHASQGMAIELVKHYDPTEDRMLKSVGLSRIEFDRVADLGMVFGWGVVGKICKSSLDFLSGQSRMLQE